ncbi:tRNA 2-thiouridine(34) synthase MnmA [Adlercreutzia sp. R25]|uniref:tRNA-specific 2-thiouridylase MnmA n=1 Tax=Adlercreutzia shanghongiae TaxID=3111773 RepID=A0ABU6IZ17_9ACTN|nr:MULTISPECIES: tRNA 2-thiouridine(34) synthase MnmA [unclassified Adlercreutzia]MEC4272787.1 tRNA 2-thiouridine(34) synthase MnmA [Adlercreutzia sp. R25]MEC4295095.1 tRNA 2-thiouridine(34) synthase MnmA [Adlercreutzia sp. R22]
MNLREKKDGIGTIASGAKEGPGTVMAAMSGGVDSSVCALLLQEAGYEVVGATMVLRDGTPAESVAKDEDGASCGSSADVEDARTVCRRLGVDHYVFDLRHRFGEAVVDRFCDDYLCGQTPNPCIDCNRYLKFEALQKARREMGLDYVATGHYARRAWDEDAGRWKLLRACDAAKDQSYVLYHLTQDTLAHMLFPLGELTKGEVRELARAHGFVTAEKPESQDICFVPDGDYAGFIEGHRGAAAAFEPGDIVNREGRVLGEHGGLVHYTIGQRKGIGVAAPEPLYVLEKDLTANRLVVGFKDETLSRGVVACDVNLIGGESFAGSRAVQVKTHYRQRPVAAIVEMSGDDELTITFDEPQRSAAPGQSAVLYDGDEVLGGGAIVRAF